MQLNKLRNGDDPLAYVSITFYFNDHKLIGRYFPDRIYLLKMSRSMFSVLFQAFFEIEIFVFEFCCFFSLCSEDEHVVMKKEREWASSIL